MTYPTVQPAADHYPLRPPSPPPYHTCSQPAPPEHYPTSRFLSGSTWTKWETNTHLISNTVVAQLYKNNLFMCCCLFFVWEDSVEKESLQPFEPVINGDFIPILVTSRNIWVTGCIIRKLGQFFFLYWKYAATFRPLFRFCTQDTFHTSPPAQLASKALETFYNGGIKKTTPMSFCIIKLSAWNTK